MRMTNAHPPSASSPAGSHRSLPLRRAVNLSLDARLVEEARELGISLSAAAEEALRARVHAAREARWKEENREAIGDYNARVASEGTFGEPFGNI